MTQNPSISKAVFHKEFKYSKSVILSIHNWASSVDSCTFFPLGK